MEFKENIMSTHDIINKTKMYFIHGPNDLVITYVVDEKITEDDIDLCFKITKEFLLTSDHLNLLKEEGINSINEITIQIETRSNCWSYLSHKYKPGPRGYQDNRYWTKDNLDNFQTWSKSHRELNSPEE